MASTTGSQAPTTTTAAAAVHTCTELNWGDDADAELYCTTIVTTRQVLSAISLVACAMLVFAIWVSKRYRNFGQRMILWLTLSAALATVPYFFGQLVAGPLCDFQAFLLTYLDWAVLLWVLSLTHSLYKNVIHQQSSEHLELRYKLVSWLVPLFFAFIPVFDDDYGPAGPWCWIEADPTRPDDTGTGMRWGVWYVWLWVGIVVLFAGNIYILSAVRRREAEWQGTFNPSIEAEKEFFKKQVRPVKYYPIIYAVLAVFPTINRIQNAVAPDSPNFTLYLLQSITSPLMGTINAMVYAANAGEGFWSLLSPASVARALATRKGGDGVTEYNVNIVPDDSDADSNLDY